ncbi:MAG: hypothetical protein PHC66_04730 [Candidatus Nanoarchaeia archaeon]|nr:hypothetical protein [Candidatus Nanoarchaeia archaeon]MDD5238992.1 hypothetical protein [Candidatus Nanoarchaeia archaeon]
MASLKKYVLVGILGIILLIAGIMVFAKLGEEVVVVQNNTTIIEPEIDEILESLERFNDPRFEDSTLYVILNAEGETNLSFKVSSLAVHNTFFDAWYPLNNISTEISGDRIILKKIFADAGVVYNEFYVYIPEAVLNENGTMRNATMPQNKFHMYNEFVELIAGETDLIEITILKDKSLFEDADGTLVFAPQIRITSHKNLTMPDIDSGQLWFNVTMGMNNNGTVEAGYKYTPK